MKAVFIALLTSLLQIGIIFKEPLDHILIIWFIFWLFNWFSIFLFQMSNDTEINFNNLKSHTCGNCEHRKYNEIATGYKWNECKLGNSNKPDNEVSLDFGCNKFEQKKGCTMKREYYLKETDISKMQDSYNPTAQLAINQIHNSAVNQIFDDLESRTCRNCEYISGQITQYCENPKSILCDTSITLDFGCNKFERKNAKNS